MYTLSSPALAPLSKVWGCGGISMYGGELMLTCEWLDFKPSAYFHTLWGQLEYWLLGMLLEAESRVYPPLPIYFCGACNSIALYLSHPSYSPFVQPFSWARGEPLGTSTWDLRQHIVDGRLQTTEEWIAVCRAEEPPGLFDDDIRG